MIKSALLYRKYQFNISDIYCLHIFPFFTADSVLRARQYLLSSFSSTNYQLLTSNFQKKISNIRLAFAESFP